MRTYTELLTLATFEERYEYLKLGGKVGDETFGFDRWLNQTFYRSAEWQRVRRDVIIRDGGRDMACEGFEIGGRIIIHHMNPITLADIQRRNGDILNPEFLVCVSHDTHNAIHYGDKSLLPCEPAERTEFDTCPWKRKR